MTWENNVVWKRKKRDRVHTCNMAISRHAQVCRLPLPKSREDSCYCCWRRVPSFTGKTTVTLLMHLHHLDLHHIYVVCKCVEMHAILLLDSHFAIFIDEWRRKLHSMTLSWSPLHGRKASIVCRWTQAIWRLTGCCDAIGAFISLLVTILQVDHTRVLTRFKGWTHEIVV